MFSFFKKQQWRLVKTIVNPVTLDKKEGKVYYHLFESNKGNRRIDIQCSIILPPYMNLNDQARKLESYQEKIYRWEMGRVDPDIPTYNQVPEEETVNVLKGKIS